jgi:hypothetical protein
VNKIIQHYIQSLRLRHIIVAFTLVFSFSNRILANQNVFHFLNYEQFQSLTEVEKKSYIKEIKYLTIDLTAHAKISLFEYLFLPTAEAQLKQRAEFNIANENAQTELDRLDTLMRATRMYKKAANTHNAPATRQIVIENSEAFVKRMNTVRRNLKTDADFKSYGLLKNEFAKISPQHAQKIESVKIPTTLAQQKPKNTEQIRTLSRSLQVRQVSSLITNSPTVNASYCIYAGFVISGKKCQPNKKLPDDFVLDEIHNDVFNCEKKSEILCNPLLFGYKKNCFKVETREVCSEKPICIQRSRNATKTCMQLTDTTEQFEHVLNLWKNPKNKTTYEKFMTDINQLCNSGNLTVTDVKQTCKVAALRFNSVIDKNFPGKSDAKITSESAAKSTK